MIAPTTSRSGSANSGASMRVEKKFPFETRAILIGRAPPL